MKSLYEKSLGSGQGQVLRLDTESTIHKRKKKNDDVDLIKI